MTGGVFIEKDTGKVLFGFEKLNHYTKEEFLAKNVENTEDYKFKKWGEIERDSTDIKPWERVKDDGSIEDTREIRGYKYILAKKVNIANKEKVSNKETLAFDKELSKKEEKELEEKTGKEIIEKEARKATPGKIDRHEK